MTDQCKHCTSRGDLDLCKKTPCFHHENWYAVEQQKVIDSLISAAEAYIESSSMTAVHVMAMRKRLQQAIKEAKG